MGVAATRIMVPVHHLMNQTRLTGCFRQLPPHTTPSATSDHSETLGLVAAQEAGITGLSVLTIRVALTTDWHRVVHTLPEWDLLAPRRQCLRGSAPTINLK